MLQHNQIGKISSSRDAFGFSFKLWLFIFITILLPLDLIYRVGPLRIALPWYQIGIDFSSLVVFFALEALCIASVSMVASLLLHLVTHQGTPIIKAVNRTVGLFIFVIIFIDYFYRWIGKVTHNAILLNRNIKYYILYICIGIFLLIAIAYYKKIALCLYQNILKTAHYFYKINIGITLICLLVTISVVSGHFYNSPRATNQSYSVVNENHLANRPNIILITFDALCTKHTSLHSFERDTTPELAKFGRESYVFDNIYASCNWTLPSLVSLLTGKHPITHEIQNSFSMFNGVSQNENLPFILKEIGYGTAASVSNTYGVPWRIKLNGFDQVSSWMGGSELINNIMKLCYTSNITSGSWLLVLMYESLLYKLADRWLDSTGLLNYLWLRPEGMNVTPELSFEMAANFLKHTRQPFFLWVHILPPHAPYVPREGFIYTFLPQKIFNSINKFYREIDKIIISLTYQDSDQNQIDQLSLRYDEHILYGDHEMGKFLSWLKETGVYEKSIILVTADHGESFERNFWSHGEPYLYQNLIQVPLVIHLPGQTQGQRIAANVSHVDLAPTILDILGVKALSRMDGKSFKEAFHNPRFDTGTKFSMALYQMNFLPNFPSSSIAAIHGDYKLIKYLKFNKYEMYNLKRDPEERKNLAGQEPERFFPLKKGIDEFLAPKTPQ